ncbi:hypothetical protein BDZ89DRAFT_1115523 [Hymenopellis radicata]|nr:hypothetical protein BDZ89DRAFT_1115523 [Hymenopellis radicata]
MASNYDSSSFPDDTNNNDSGTSNDLDAIIAEDTRPMLSENPDSLQAPGADEFRTTVDPTPFFKHCNPPTGFEARLNSPELPKIDASLVDLNPQDTTHTNTDYPAQPYFGSNASQQPQTIDDGNQVSTTIFYDENRAYPSSSYNETQGNFYDVFRPYTFVYDVNQPFSSVAPLPGQLDFTPPANLNSFPTWGVAPAAPLFDFIPYFPVIPEAEAEPEVEYVPYVPLVHSSLGSARRIIKAAQGPYASARCYTSPSSYSKTTLPASGRKALSKICPTVNYYYRSDSHGCCVAGCPEEHGRYTREELWTHMDTHREIRKAKRSNNRCPIDDCGVVYQSARSLTKHIENAHHAERLRQVSVITDRRPLRDAPAVSDEYEYEYELGLTTPVA